MSDTDATYGELVDAAFTAAGRASFALMRNRFDDSAQAREAVAAYRDLLDAVLVHAQYLNPQLRGNGAVGDHPTTDSVGLSGLPLFARSVALLSSRARRSFPGGERAFLPEVAVLWRQAATSLRASQDLLDTHRSPDFAWRSPDAWLVDHPMPQAAATESLAGFLRAIAGSGQALALRAYQVDRSVYCTDILDAAALRLAAASLSHYARASRGVPALDELRATRETYGARTGTGSLSAARSAIEQLRQHAWRHARSEHVSIRTLGTYAALANTIYQHAAVIADAGAARAAQLRLGADPAVITTRLQRSSELSVAAATSWRDVRLACTALRTTTVPAAELYELVLVVRTGLESVTRDSDGWRLGTAILPDRDEAQRIFTDIRMLIAPMEEISAWHGVAVATLAETGSLYMSAGDVDREQLSEDHTLAAALLSRRPVPLPQRQTVELLEAFARADDATWAVAKASAAANFYGHLQRPAFSTMRQMHRAAGRPAIGL